MSQRAATRPDADPVAVAIRAALARLAELQGADGAWSGVYGGPMFLLPMYVAARHVARRPIPAERRARLCATLRAAQNADGSIGLHAEQAAGCMFTSALGYVALRMLGVPAGDPDALRLRRWIRANGTPLGAASWGKLVLCVLGLYEYPGLHPVTPELWLLPSAAPLHPSRMWCHCRQVYLPMAWLYGSRAVAPPDDLTHALRRELYDQPYAEIPFAAHRDTLSPADCIVPADPLLGPVNRLTGLFETVAQRSPLRRRALSRLREHMDYEDRVTDFIRIGPVNAALNTLVCHFDRPGSAAEARSFERLEEYIWDDGTQAVMNGYNSTALWDTAFAVQAIQASRWAGQWRETLQRAHGFIRDNQVLEDPPQAERYFRHRSRGGWPFSDRAHGWPITDCTAEGFKCAVSLAPIADAPVPEPLLMAAVDLMLSFQNPDGGWASYELQRAGRWIERLNPSQVFSDIMTDYSYVECTSAVLQALARARARFPGWRERKLRRAIRRGERFLRAAQRPDGSWAGSWAVCFTYGTWFGVSGLLAAGADGCDTALRRACDFLTQRQRPDGSWGEAPESCVAGRYVPRAAGHVVNTAWALSALARCGQGRCPAATRGAHYLLDTQLPSGDWPHQGMVGVFNRTTLIDYDNYRRYFPLWALAEQLQA